MPGYGLPPAPLPASKILEKILQLVDKAYEYNAGGKL
jgi:hypothetical protein